jgi:hypothetical protein
VKRLLLWLRRAAWIPFQLIPFLTAEEAVYFFSYREKGSLLEGNGEAASIAFQRYPYGKTFS